MISNDGALTRSTPSAVLVVTACQPCGAPEAHASRAAVRTHKRTDPPLGSSALVKDRSDGTDADHERETHVVVVEGHRERHEPVVVVITHARGEPDVRGV